MSDHDFNIRDLSEQTLLLQLAEEAAELSQAAAKLARQEYGFNPTGRSIKELQANLEEELSDVLLAAAMLPYRPQWDIISRKKSRWQQRLNNRYNNQDLPG
jgi:hypothetical protein